MLLGISVQKSAAGDRREDRRKEGKVKFEGRRTILRATGALVAGLLSIASANGKAAPQRTEATAEKPVMAEQVFKNVQVFRGISVKEFQETMGFFVAATPFGCGTCHGYASGDTWESYAEDTPMKQTTRKMILMVNALNQSYFGGKRELTCYSCHRNAVFPKVTPILAEQYATPPPEDLDEIPLQAAGSPSPDQVLEKYLQAVGGVQKLATFTSFVAKGTYQGYDDPGTSPVEIYAKAPNQFFQVVHGYNGDSALVDDGLSTWVTQSERDAPLRLLALAAGDLDGAHLESELYFPVRIKQLLTKLRVGFPVTGVPSILPDKVLGVGTDDRELTVVQGTTLAGNNVKLYFERELGLLVRMVRYTNLPVGFAPTEIDYSDYRNVSGIKLPFRMTKTWVNGRSVTELSSIQVNVSIDAAKFARPTP
jgi:F0F1-type ATP synthase membrane subunit c/vacuolar-type H+-ATPase subunit K